MPILFDLVDQTRFVDHYLNGFGGLDRSLERGTETVGDDVRQAVTMRFARIDRDLKLTPTVEVDVPPPIAERALMRAQYRAAVKPDVKLPTTIGDILLEFVRPEYDWLVNDEPIAEFDPETDGWDDPRGTE